MHDHHEKGFVLITVILLTTILSVGAFIAFEQSQLGYRVQTSRLAYQKAIMDSENKRMDAVKTIARLIDELPNNSDKYVNLSEWKELEDEQKQNRSTHTYLKLHPPKLSNEGSSLIQNRAYSGLGAGAAQSRGIVRYAEVKAKGVAEIQGRAVEAWTAADIRLVLD